MCFIKCLRRLKTCPGWHEGRAFLVPSSHSLVWLNSDGSSMGLSHGNAAGIRGADVLAGRSGMKRGRQKTTRVSSRGGTALPAQARPRFHGARVTLHFYAPNS